MSPASVGSHLPVDMRWGFRPTIPVDMTLTTNKAKILALMLGLVFLAAQFHFCADLNAGGTGTHFCPFCSTTGSVIATPIPIIVVMPLVVRLEVILAPSTISPEVAPSISPRAPPSI